jgi:hypothetical protein
MASSGAPSSPATAPRPQGYALAFDEARRALEDQERSVEQLRSRSGALVAAAAITTSFFGGQTLHGNRLHTFAWIAVGAFVGIGLSTICILWPRRDWEFSLDPARFITTYLEPPQGGPLPIDQIHRDLALHMGASAMLNRGQLRWLIVAFRVGALLLIIDVVAWVVVLAEQS